MKNLIQTGVGGQRTSVVSLSRGYIALEKHVATSVPEVQKSTIKL